MGRPRKWDSDAERMRARRAELDQSLDEMVVVMPGTPEPPMVVDVVDEPALPEIPRGRNAPPLEAYVAEAKLLARRDAVARKRDDVEIRVQAAERYARWRHAGFVAGTVAGL